MKLILSIIAAEALTQLACKGEIFDNLREWLKSLTRFTFLLLSCSYCVSVWVAASVTIMYFTWEYSQFFVVVVVVVVVVVGSGVVVVVVVVVGSGVVGVVVS